MQQERDALHERIDMLVHAILDDYKKDRLIDAMDVFRQPDVDAVEDIAGKLLNIFFPGYYKEKIYRSFNDDNRVSVLIEDVIYNLRKQIQLALRYREDCRDAAEEALFAEAEEITLAFFERVPKIREFIDTDIQATFDGDPAAHDPAEIVLSYPGLLATTINRAAHELYLLNVPLIPRMMTEYAHSVTGIDINPGATIGKYFMIDHGTGVVIGETAEIGCHVKIYQSVTIGALSTRGGQSLRGKKRHPTIEDNVTIYSGASIFGGATVIGRDSVIGSNAFITTSIRPGTRVTIRNQELIYRTDGEASFGNTELEQGDTWYYNI